MARNKEKENIIQPSNIFKMLKIKNMEEASKVLDTAFKLLVYLKPGDELKCGGVTFAKLDTDLIHVQTKVSAEEIADTLSQKQIIRIPV
jgi:hypothetical protein